MSSVEADWNAITAAARVWDGAADGLDGAWRRLHGTTGSPMAPDVAAAFETFREAWVDEVKDVATTAQAHAESLDDAAATYSAVDDAAYQRIRSLMPWSYRDSTIDPDGGPPPMPTPSPGPSPSPPPPSDSAPATPQPSPGPSPTPSPSPTGGD
jgi:hypothetical protein